jgi:hypothetical protein
MNSNMNTNDNKCNNEWNTVQVMASVLPEWNTVQVMASVLPNVYNMTEIVVEEEPPSIVEPSCTKNVSQTTTCFARVGKFVHYDARFRDWYTDTRNIQEPMWSSLYHFFGTIQMGMTYSEDEEDNRKNQSTLGANTTTIFKILLHKINLVCYDPHGSSYE